ncbi:MAG: calcium-binding protein, partial [Cyanobacteria bacterium J06592_8]
MATEIKLIKKELKTMSNEWVWNTENLNAPEDGTVRRVQLFKDTDPYDMETNQFNNDFDYWELESVLFSHSYYKYKYKEEVNGTDGGDTIIGSTDRAAYYWNDHLDHDGKWRSLAGDDDDKVVTIEAQEEYLYGKSGDDYIAGGDGDDYIEGNLDNDVLIAGDGTDTVLGGSGSD